MIITISKRTRFFLAVEGEGEQSFIKWLQQLSDQNGLHIHLDCEVLNGGGYKTMLEKTKRARKRKDRSKAKATILLVDSDRDKRDDGWSLEELNEKAKEENIIVCIQHPNQEGWLLKMFSGKENLQPDASNVKKLLFKVWREYQKPVDAQTLSKKYTLNHVLRAAEKDADLKDLLVIIGLLQS